MSLLTEALEAEMLKTFKQIEDTEFDLKYLRGKIIGLKEAIEVIKKNEIVFGNLYPHGGKADISEEMLG